MNTLNFEWNANKSASNIQKHGVSFDEAKTVFTDENARLIVCHCIREAEKIRIISARKADKQERKIYEGYRHA